MLDSEALSQRTERLTRELDRALDALEGAPDFAKARYQQDLFALGSDLLDSDDGVLVLRERAARFDAAGVFHAGPWEEPSRLIPALVGGSLRGEGLYPTVEALSMLRVLALAEGRVESASMTADEAREFLGEATAKNFEFLLGPRTEEARSHPKLFARAQRLFELIQTVVDPRQVFERVVQEVEAIAGQRPILTAGLEDLVDRALRLAASLSQGADGAAPGAERLERYRRSMGAATPLSHASEGPLDYRRRLMDLPAEDLVSESRTFAELLQETGLGSPYHAVVLRRLARKAPESIGEALAASDRGVAEARACAELAGLLIEYSLVPDTHSVILGLLGVLERSLLSRGEVAGGLRKVADLDIRPEVARALLEPFPESTGLTANGVLLGGCLAVLGLPLGIGQGNNPTCQSARGISLWSQHAPGQLLAMVASVARDGFYQTTFEGHTLRSDTLHGGVAPGDLQRDLDPVSQVLVPHLDRVYDHMMTLAAHRSEDGHRWVNPVLYGRWIQPGFASVFEQGTGLVQRHESFVRRFFATHHPLHNEGHELIYPNPVGIMITDAHGRLLGRHAVSIQRIAREQDAAAGSDPYRVYFFNPNNEGRQDWGGGVRPTVFGHGERHGESSLPFGQFTSRLYAFHYDPHEQGDAFAVPAGAVREVTAAAAETWGQSIAGFA